MCSATDIIGVICMHRYPNVEYAILTSIYVFFCQKVKGQLPHQHSLNAQTLTGSHGPVEH